MKRRLNLVCLLLFTLIASNASAFSRISVEPNGNLLNDGVRTMDYTAWNLPKLITKTSGANAGSTLAYEYDASHARIKEVSTLHGTTYYAGGYELVIPTSSTAAQNQTEERTYVSSPEGTIGVITQKTTANATGAAATSTDTAYWHKDHLGSLIAITNPSGSVTQRFRFDAWGNRDCLTTAGVVISCSSSNTGGANNTGSEERGFTGHEMLDEVGLIHMNGRLFDPAIARFTQADPIIQEPLNSQNYNRYSYVLNNPLVYTDPSGYSAWTKVRKPLAAVAIMVATYGMGSSIAVAGYEATAIATDAAVTAGAMSAEAGAASMAAAGVTAGNISAAFSIAGGFAAGGVTGGNIESAVLGAIQATASMGIGDATYHGSTPPSAGLYAANVLAHAALGCGMAAAQGGSCKSGALAAGFSAAAGPVVAGLTDGNFYGGLAGRMAAGCAGSMIGGGSCEAGAVTAAFDYLYNAKGRGAPREPTPENVLARAQIRQYLEEAYGPSATSFEPANWQPTSRDFSNLRAVHGNSSSSLREQHLYEIWDARDDSLYKIGVSGRPLNLNGSSGRANSQVNLLNRGAGENVFEAVVARQCVPCRADVLRIEQNGVTAYKNFTNSPPPGNLRPTP